MGNVCTVIYGSLHRCSSMGFGWATQRKLHKHYAATTMLNRRDLISQLVVFKYLVLKLSLSFTYCLANVKAVACCMSLTAQL